MDEAGKKPLLKRGRLLPVIGLVLVAALILLFLGLRAGGWAAKKENMQLLTLVNADHPVPDDRQQEYSMLDEGWMLDARCADELTLLLDECRGAGYTPEIRDALVTRAMQSERFEARCLELTAQGLDEETARAEAAIRDRGEELGEDVSVAVTCGTRDGLPVPAEVTLTGSLTGKQREALTEWIGESFALPRERIHFQTEETKKNP